MLHHRHLRFLISLLLICSSIFLVAPAAAQEGGQTHTVQVGENLYRIALRYGLTVDQLAVANGIVDVSQIYVGQVLNIPTAAQPAPAAPQTEQSAAPSAEAASTSTDPQYHTVQRGETLAGIARIHGMNVTQLATLNNLADPNHLIVGQRLLLTGSNPTPPVAEAAAPPVEAAAAPAAAGAEVRHTVQANEGLSTIAGHYGVSWTTIAQVNSISNPNLIYAGQQLIIPDPTLSPPADYGQPAPVTAPNPSRWILVNLTNQKIYAYEGEAMVKEVTVSTGLPGTPTVVGDYYVYTKLPSQTMSGPGYYLPGVPWVMYFYQGYAIHGTYWHSNFGQPMSHGCVNLPPADSEWFYNFASVGTLVRVTY